MAERFQFDARYRVGIEEIDHEHQELFDVIEKVYASFLSNSETALAAAHRHVAELIARTCHHCANEESRMGAEAYPGLETHREAHRKLLTQLKDLQLRVEAEDRHLPVYIYHFLHSWLICHILTEDMKFGKFMAQRRAKDAGVSV
jgi:hemerythrin